MRACPVYAYDLTGKFVFEAPSQIEMAKLLGVRSNNISVVCGNNIPGLDNGRYTAGNHYVRLYKKDQLTEEEMMPESRKQRIEAAKRNRCHPRGKYRPRKKKI